MLGEVKPAIVGISKRGYFFLLWVESVLMTRSIREQGRKRSEYPD